MTTYIRLGEFFSLTILLTDDDVLSSDTDNGNQIYIEREEPDVEQESRDTLSSTGNS